MNVLEDLKAENEARRKSENGLRDAETRYRLLFEYSPDGIVILDPATARPLEFNETACRQLGYSREEFARLAISDYEASETPKETFARIARVLREGRNDFETRHRTRSGEIRDIHVTAQITEILGKPVYHCVWRDITERKRAEAGLRDSEENMRYIVKHDPNAIAVYDRDLHYIAVSDRYLQDYGVKEEDVIGKHHYEVFPEMPQRWKDVHQRCLAGAIERDDDDFFERPDGSITYNRWECRPWRRADGEIGGIITYTEVTTERKKAEMALREREQRLSNIYETVGDVIFHIAVEPGGQFRFISINRAFSDVTGLKPEQVVGKLASEIIPEPSLTMVLENYRKAIEGKTMVYWEEVSDYPSGQVIGEVSVVPVFDDQGRCTHLVGSVHDVTERTRAEKALKASEEKFRMITEQIADLISITDDRGVVIYASPASRALFLYEPEEMSGRHFKEFLDPASAPKALAAFLEARTHGTRAKELELMMKRKDGSVFIGELSGSNFPYGEKNGSLVVIRDITERKKAEEILRESDVRLNKLVTWVPGMIYRFKRRPDGSYCVPFTTEAIRGIFGCSPEDVREDFAPIARVIVPEDFDRVVASIEDSAEHLAAWSCEYRVRIPGGPVRWMLGNATPERSDDGGITWYGYNMDITERKRTEDAVQSSLREKEILLREIHHRVKNNMQVISSLLNLQADHVADADARRMLKEGQLRIRSMALIHEKLYQARDLSKVEFASYIQSLTAHLFQFFKVDPGQVRLESDLEDVRLDINTAVPCGLLFNELISNALKHAFPGERKGTVRIRLWREEDGGLKLRVADDGVGIPQALDLRRAESFGLQIVDLLIGQIEGKIELDRTNGTDFTVAFRELGYKPRT